MWFFGKRKPKNPYGKVEEFLCKVDDALVRAYRNGDVQLVAPFLITPCLEDVTDDILSGRDHTQELGLDKYRIRTWCDYRACNNGGYIVHKQVRHKDVKIRGMISIPVGDNIDEDWFVVPQGDSYVVRDIRRCAIC